MTWRRFNSALLLAISNCRIVALLLMLALVAPLASAADEEPGSAAWLPPEPMPVGYDWIMLESGEWLKGTLIALYDDVLEFDSDKLDEQSFDWEDVVIVKTSNVFEVLYADRSTSVGRLIIRDDKITVVGSAQEPRSRHAILSLAGYGQSFLSLWDGDISASIDFRDGSSSRRDYALRVDTQRRTSENRFKFNYQYAYSEVDSSKVEDSQRLTTSLDIFISQSWFIRPAQFEYFSDEFQNIDERYTFTTSIGYHIIDNSRTTWDVFAGPGYQLTHYVTVETGRKEKEETAVGVVGTFFDIELTSNIDYDFLYEGQWVDEDAGAFNHHVDTGLSIEFLGDFDLDVRFILDRVEKPVPKADGTVPDRNDTRLQVGLSYEF